MCPSFMATREEEHSTRGRANALRAALSGTLPHDELTSERMFEVMDLCIECKACKAECPSSVDMAKIKIEFLATYYDRHRLPLRSRLFADIGRASRLLAGAARRRGQPAGGAGAGQATPGAVRRHQRSAHPACVQRQSLPRLGTPPRARPRAVRA